MIEDMGVQWRVQEFLEEQGKTAYQLIGTSGLNAGTIYQIVKNKKKGAEFETLERVLIGLEKLIGREVEISEILKRDLAKDVEP